MGYTRLKPAAALVALALLVVAPAAFAQTTRGAISGTVVDQGGEPLPGVTVTATSPALIAGQKTVVTDAEGDFRIPALPPGNYTVQFRLEGFQELDQQNVRVNIASTTPLQATMTSSFTEELLVTSDIPVINTNSTEVSTNFNEDYFRNMPTGRDYTSVAQTTPGAAQDASGQTFYGSTGAENAYYIDGVNTTGVELGQQGKTLNFEFIEEVQVKTAGYSAEYGRNTGGIINVITKSGGNEFHGDVFGYFEPDSLRNDLSDEASAGAVSGSLRTAEEERQDYGVDLGGYLIQDKMWFFAAYDRVVDTDTLEATDDFSSVGGPTEGTAFEDETTRDLYAAKLTWLLNPRHTLSASGFGDPSTREGALGSLAAPPTHFQQKLETGALDAVLNYDGVLSDSWIITGKISTHEEESKVEGAGKDLVGFIDNTDPLGDGTVVFGWPGAPGDAGFGFFQDQEFGRDQYHLDATWFAENLGGDHEFKFGAEYEEVSVNNANSNSGGERIYRFNCNDPACEGPYYYRHRFFVAERKDPLDMTAADIRDPLVVDTTAEDEAYFVQDTWRVLPNLTFNLGVRYDVQTLFNADGEVQQELDDALAPRVGFVWDPLSDGRSKIYAHYGTFYETIPMDIVIRSYGGEITTFSYNFSDQPGDVTCSAALEGAGINNCTTLGGGFSRVDPSTDSQHVEELVVGGEYEVIPNLAVGIKYIQRDLKNIMEDALSADGDYFIGNPGEGLMTGTFDLGYAFGYNDTLHTLPIPTREFTGVELTVQKRPTRNFQFLGSVLWSELEGSYDGLFQASTGQLDPNLNSAFDYFDFSVNNVGKLSNDREWQVKWDGLYTFDFGLSLGLSTHYRTGLPITAFGYSSGYQNWEYYLSERGAFGETDDEYEADLHLGYPIRFGNNLELNLLVDIFNVLDRQGETSVNDRFTNAEEQFFTPFYVPLDWVTGETFTLDPNNPQVAPTNGGWLTSDQWQRPRTIRVGARLTW